jgi:hypothetical protein
MNERKNRVRGTTRKRPQYPSQYVYNIIQKEKKENERKKGRKKERKRRKEREGDGERDGDGERERE